MERADRELDRPERVRHGAERITRSGGWLSNNRTAAAVHPRFRDRHPLGIAALLHEHDARVALFFRSSCIHAHRSGSGWSSAWSRCVQVLA